MNSDLAQDSPATTDDTGSFRIEYNLYSGVALFNFAGLNPKYTKVRIDGGAERRLINHYQSF